MTTDALFDDNELDYPPPPGYQWTQHDLQRAVAEEDSAEIAAALKRGDLSDLLVSKNPNPAE